MLPKRSNVLSVIEMKVTNIENSLDDIIVAFSKNYTQISRDTINEIFGIFIDISEIINSSFANRSYVEIDVDTIFSIIEDFNMDSLFEHSIKNTIFTFVTLSKFYIDENCILSKRNLDKMNVFIRDKIDQTKRNIVIISS